MLGLLDDEFFDGWLAPLGWFLGAAWKAILGLKCSNVTWALQSLTFFC